MVNKPLDPHQFDYEGLGLKDDEDPHGHSRQRRPYQAYSQEREAREGQELRPLGYSPGAAQDGTRTAFRSLVPGA